MTCRFTTLFLLFASLCWAHFAETAAAQTKVISYNIRYLNKSDGDDVWPNRSSEVIKTIARADLVGLQEVVDQQFKEIQEGRKEFTWFGVGRDDGDKAGEAVPVGWRTSKYQALDRGVFWLSETPDEVGSKGWDAALPRISTWVRLKDKAENQEILFINTHFDHRGVKARAESAHLIREWIKENQDGASVVLTGDFNATAQQAPIKNLLDGGVIQDAREVSSVDDPGPRTTWSGFKSIEGERRIDFIFVAGLEVSSFETLNPKTTKGRFASDHLPVLAVVKSKEQSN